MIRVALIALLCAAGVHAAQARSFYIEGAGGVPLAVTDAGAVDAPAILFLHGIGHGRDSFQVQFTSHLTENYRLVAFDLRGHGMSGKPWRAADYAEAAIWAEDVARVMDATGLIRPVVVAWSYGTLVAADMVRVGGAPRIAGVVMVSALGGLEAQAPQGEIPPDLAKARLLQPQPSLADQQDASRLVARYLTDGPAPAPWRDTTLALNLMVPPYVQPLVRQHASDNRDLVARFTMPVLIVHGAKDAAVQQAAVDSLVQRLPNGLASRYDAAGHTPFVEDAPRFNRELAAFVESVRSNQ
ncbi:MAG: alpha/beta hydrolase [Rhodospirillaceae bacterium]|nr:alpha/beta hydrolase [Rhodospirillaceae bacterium]